MKNTPIIVVLVLMLILIGMLFYRLHSLEKQIGHEHHKTENEHHGHDNDDDDGEDDEDDDDEYPLGEKMSRFFYFKNKLGTAVRHENQELSLFYLEEIEEIAEGIIGDDVYHEGIHISVLMQDKLMPAIEHLEEELENPSSAKKQDAFENLVNSCNSCHKLAEHPFIHVEVPKEDIDGQNFNPVK